MSAVTCALIGFLVVCKITNMYIEIKRLEYDAQCRLRMLELSRSNGQPLDPFSRIINKNILELEKDDNEDIRSID
jgi:hypothetical protein